MSLAGRIMNHKFCGLSQRTARVTWRCKLSEASQERLITPLRKSEGLYWSTYRHRPSTSQSARVTSTYKMDFGTCTSQGDLEICKQVSDEASTCPQVELQVNQLPAQFGDQSLIQTSPQESALMITDNQSLITIPQPNFISTHASNPNDFLIIPSATNALIPEIFERDGTVAAQECPPAPVQSNLQFLAVPAPIPQGGQPRSLRRSLSARRSTKEEIMGSGGDKKERRIIDAQKEELDRLILELDHQKTEGIHRTEIIRNLALEKRQLLSEVATLQTQVWIYLRKIRLVSSI